MRKSVTKDRQADRPRVLARILAEDLRNIRVAGTGGFVEAGATVSETGTRGQDDWDITNVGSDGDAYVYRASTPGYMLEPLRGSFLQQPASLALQ